MIEDYVKKFFPPGKTGDSIVYLEPWRKVIADGFDVAKKPDCCGVWLQDLLPATEFRDRYRQEKKVPLTYTCMLIKVIALTLKRHPVLNSSLSKGRLVIHSSIDIGVTAAGQEVLAPVVVIQQADTKPLNRIVAELREGGRRAGELQRQNLEKLNKVGRWIPAFIRRQFLKWALRSPRIRNPYTGTFQIAVLSEFPGFAIPMFLSTTFMLAITGIAKRPVVVRDKVEVRPTAYLHLLGDHRLIAGREALAALRHFQHLLLNPEELDD